MTRCGTCGTTWHGLTECHCAAESSAAIPLAMWDRYAGLLSERYTELHERSVDAGGVPGELLADLVGAQPGGAHAGRLDPPSGIPVFSSVLVGGQWSQVLWSVVGPVVVDVVNVVLGRDSTLEHPVLIGLDVLPHTDPPPQADIAVRGDVPLRLIRGDLFARRKSANGSQSSLGSSASRAPALLAGALNGRPAADANDGWHEWSLQVRALCHRHFGSVDAFDRHRQGPVDTRHCVEPATVLRKDGKPVFRAADRSGRPTWVVDKPARVFPDKEAS